MKLTDVIEHFILDSSSGSRAKKTLVSYRQRLSVLVWLLQHVCRDGEELVRIVELEQVTVFYLRQCVQHLLASGEMPEPSNPKRKGRQPANGKGFDVSTVRAYVRVWKAFFNWCYYEELIDVNPVARLRSPKPVTRVVPTFTVEHVEKMLATCDLSTEVGFRNYVILLLLLDSGMRLSELAGLRVADVHDRYVKVFGKGRKEREIGLRPEVSKLLWKYIHKYRKPKDLGETGLFLGRGKPLGEGGIKAVIKSIKQACGIEGVRVSAHTFRHTFAKMYLEQGGEVFKLSREMGHSDVKITKVYLEDFNSSEARKEHDAFSPIARLNLNKRSRRKHPD